MFKSPFSFEGRIRRTEFGLSMLAYLTFNVGLNLLVADAGDAGAIIMLVVFIPLIWFTCAQSAKRCHDVGRSGWWQLIPFYGFVLLFSEGDHLRNSYGPNPKHPDVAGDILESETLDGYLRNPPADNK